MKKSFFVDVVISMAIVCILLSFINLTIHLWLLQKEKDTVPNFGFYRIESIEGDRIHVSKYEQDLLGTERFVTETKTFSYVNHHDAKVGGFISKSHIWHNGETLTEYVSERDAKNYFGWKSIPATE